MEPMKRQIKPALQLAGLWGMVLRMHRAARWLQRVGYWAAVSLRLGFTVQLRFLPPQFLEQPVFVSPSSIQKALPIYLSRIENIPPTFKPVLGGDWDLRAEPLLPYMWDLIHFRLMYEMFAEDKPFEETSQYKKMEREILSVGETVDHHFRSMEQVVEHLKEYEHVFKDIQETGYKTQEELGNPGFAREIKVCIDRNGAPVYLTEGTHRLAMVKILGLERVPVGIWTVHEIWAQRCFKKYGGGLLGAVSKGLADIECDQQNGKMRTEEITSSASKLEIALDPVDSK